MPAELALPALRLPVRRMGIRIGLPVHCIRGNGNRRPFPSNLDMKTQRSPVG